MLIEVHIIQNHAPSNLNRDDSGSPKSAIFGGYRRARISSQCLKRCYRTSKTFRDEVDGLGMHTRSMPDEIRRRLLAHAATVTDPALKATFVEWAQKSQARLAAILGKGEGGGGKGADEEEESSPSGTQAENGEDDSGEETDAGAPTAKPEKYQTAQSIFWRTAELDALFNAYCERIEWDAQVPDKMRKAFDNKGKVKAQDMAKCLDDAFPNGRLGDEMKGIKKRRESDNTAVDARHKAPQNESADAKKKREKKLKDAKAKVDEHTAKALQQLILDRFDPKEILRDGGLRPDGIPVDMALFGRMIASPLMHNVEASSQFAHAISTHEWAREFDLWTRVDDRRDKRLDFYKSAFGAEEKLESGTDGMGDAEFTSACYYSYFNVDFEALVDNLTGKALKHDLDDSKDKSAAKARACNAVIGLVKAAIFERPTGKFNSMATPSLPTLVLVEVRDDHVPVSYADAFAKPVDPKNEEKQNDHGQIERVDLPKESASRLIKGANRITKAFGRTAKSRLLFTGGEDIGASLESGTVPATTVTSIEDLIKNLCTAIGCPESK